MLLQFNHYYSHKENKIMLNKWLNKETQIFVELINLSLSDPYKTINERNTWRVKQLRI